MTANAASKVNTLSPDQLAFRRTMGAFATGVAVLTTSWQGSDYGMTINSLTSLSLDPCLLLVCTVKGSLTGQAIAGRRAFGVSLLAHDQQHVSSRFVGQVPDRFKGIDTIASENGIPLIAGALAHFDCSVYDIHEGGDHDIIVGRVDRCHAHHGEPLLFFRGGYGSFNSPRHHEPQPA
jgi:3-hydroxy-9,10-secoandrosta-1,3,5(10)-triene-9,17-dione monooxygenase reductase component